jgi:hypothetical protein
MVFGWMGKESVATATQDKVISGSRYRRGTTTERGANQH